MYLKVNEKYETDFGFIVPRSHMTESFGQRYCIVQVITGGHEHFTSRHTTMTTKEISKLLHLKARERIYLV